MIDINELRQSLGTVQQEEVAELLDRIETAEKAKDDWLYANAPGGWIDNLRIKCDALRAKIAEMEKQEPVAWCATDETGTVIEALGMNQSRRFDTALYLAPGAKGE